MKARYLKRATLEELREAVPDSLSVYRTGSFHYLEADSSKHFQVNFDADEAKIALFKTPDHQGELFEEHNCLTCYEALPGLTPYEARDERLWAYLTHTSLLDYTRKRWPIPDDDEAAVNQIRQHFFGKDKRAIERDNGASRLWWMAFLCQRATTFDVGRASSAPLSIRCARQHH